MEASPDRQGDCQTFAMATDRSRNSVAVTGTAMEMGTVKGMVEASESVREPVRAPARNGSGRWRWSWRRRRRGRRRGSAAARTQT
jgi:hypothetical protein